MANRGIQEADLGSGQPDRILPITSPIPGQKNQSNHRPARAHPSTAPRRGPMLGRDRRLLTSDRTTPATLPCLCRATASATKLGSSQHAPQGRAIAVPHFAVRNGFHNADHTAIHHERVIGELRSAGAFPGLRSQTLPNSRQLGVSASCIVERLAPARSR